MPTRDAALRCGIPKPFVWCKFDQNRSINNETATGRQHKRDDRKMPQTHTSHGAYVTRHDVTLFSQSADEINKSWFSLFTCFKQTYLSNYWRHKMDTYIFSNQISIANLIKQVWRLSVKFQKTQPPFSAKPAPSALPALSTPLSPTACGSHTAASRAVIVTCVNWRLSQWQTLPSMTRQYIYVN